MDSHPIATIASVAHGGHGVCRIAGQVCFVAQGLPGDVVRVRVAKETKGVLWGVIEEVVEASPDRTAPCCDRFGVCGGCFWLHFAYPAQGQWKRRIVHDCLERIAKISCDVTFEENPELRLGYRTRAEFHSDDGRLGFYAPESHTVVDIRTCPLCHERLNQALERLRGARTQDAIEIVVNPEGPEVLVAAKRPSRSLCESFEFVNASGDAAPHRFVFDGVPIVNGAFSQASLLLNRLLVGVVARMAAGASRVLDLYCGNGNLSLGLSEASRVLGIDQSRVAVEAANAAGRGEYRTGGETEFRRALKEPWDVVVLDPPRTGAKGVAEVLAGSACGRIVYVSCDPATLARDLKTITARGWRLAEAVALDLFPNTAHVETVCLLERA